MVVAARQYLFGTIQISTKKAFSVHKYLNQYRDTLDGILVWIALLKEKDNRGNISMRIENLLVKILWPLGNDCPGCLLKFTHDLASIYGQLEILGLNVDNHHGKINLLGHFNHVGFTVAEFLSWHCHGQSVWNEQQYEVDNDFHQKDLLRQTTANIVDLYDL